MVQKSTTQKPIACVISGLMVVGLLVCFTACSSEPVTPSAPPVTTVPPATVIPTVERIGRPSGPMSVGDLATAASARTPVPTPEPGPVARKISEFTAAQGLTNQSFLGLSADDWSLLILAALFVLVGYFFLTFLLNRLLKRLVSKTSMEANDEICAGIRRDAKWLIFLLLTHYCVIRLGFLGDGLRMIMDDLIYLVCLVLATKIALRLTDLAIGEYRILLEQQGKQDDQISEDQLDPLITALHRLSGLLVVVIALSIGLAHFGLNVSSLLIALVLFGFILSFGAKDIVTDAISGLILLVDQPFRPGDAILIKDLDTWGDVVEIGTRSTRLRTADRRMVAVPNSRIVQSEVVNYTSPDPLFRAKTEVRIAYNTDMETVRQIITAAVRNVEGVLADRPVDVLFIGFGDSTRSVDVRWWIEGVHMRQHMLDQVNSALETALAQAHIYMPYTTYALQVKVEDEEVVEKPADHGLSAAR